MSGSSDSNNDSDSSVNMLKKASWEGDYDKVKMLIDMDTDINSHSYDDGKNAFHLVSKGSLFKRSNLTEINSRIKCLELLLDRGVDINGKDFYGKTALQFASWDGNKDVVEFLLNRGANINDKDNQGQSALILASSHGNKDVVELLLNRGANINEKDNQGRSAILFASSHGYKDVVEMLLDRGANIHDKDNSGRSVLMWAVEGNEIELVKLFLSRGVNINEKDNMGRTIIYYIRTDHTKYKNIFKRWEITMGIVAMQDLMVYKYIDASTVKDLYQFLEEPEKAEPDYSSMAWNWGYGPSCGSLDR